MIPKNLNKDSGISPTWQILWSKLVWSFNALFQGLWLAKDLQVFLGQQGPQKQPKLTTPLQMVEET